MRKAFQRSAWETPISQNIIQHTVALSSVSVRASDGTSEHKLHSQIWDVVKTELLALRVSSPGGIHPRRFYLPRFKDN